MNLRTLLSAVGLACVLPSCSSNVTTEPGGAGGTAGASTSSGGGAASGGAGSGAGGSAGWTDCSSPDGFRICGGPAACPTDGDCVYCFDEDLALTGGVSTCATPAMVEFGLLHGCFLCSDGDICVSFHGGSANLCAPFHLGVLYAQASAADNVSYADHGAFTGGPLPEPTTCPAVSGVTICGGNCGGCVPGSVCSGRSPLHPYGMCLPSPGTLSCVLGTLACTEPGEACFVYTVDPEAQPWADQNGYCMPLAACQAAAAGLPGGGKCVVF